MVITDATSRIGGGTPETSETYSCIWVVLDGLEKYRLGRHVDSKASLVEEAMGLVPNCFS
jgi:hypothetical protein